LLQSSAEWSLNDPEPTHDCVEMLKHVMMRN
jgi:hypothetical protein